MRESVFREREVDVAEYFEKYVELSMTEAACAKCPNYNRVWSCPQHGFDVVGLWKSYRSLRLCSVQIFFPQEQREKVSTQEGFAAAMLETVYPKVRELDGKLRQLERENPGSRMLAPGGQCMLCPEGCSKPEGKPCRRPEEMRQSLESLGGNVVKTAEELLGLPLQWAEGWRLPEYMAFTGGVLLP